MSVLKNLELTGKVRAIILLGDGHPIKVNPYPVAIKYPSLDETRNPGSDTMSKDQINQKLKLMVEAPRIDLYSITPLTQEPFGIEVWM